MIHIRLLRPMPCHIVKVSKMIAIIIDHMLQIDQFHFLAQNNFRTKIDMPKREEGFLSRIHGSLRQG